MAKYRNALPQLEGGIFLSYYGMETDLIFNRGVDLPGFASYPLLETEEGRETLRGYTMPSSSTWPGKKALVSFSRVSPG